MSDTPANDTDRESITCPQCGMRSYHPDDIREGYCGRCHDWTAKTFLPIPGGWHIKVRDDGEACIDVLKMMYNYRVVLSDRNHQTVEHGWCYYGHGVDLDGRPRSMLTALLSAMAAAQVWDGYGAPPGFDKQAL